MRIPIRTVLLWLSLSAPAMPMLAGALPPALPLVVQAAPLLGGAYAVAGRNPDGTSYQGTALVRARSDGSFEFLWRVGAFHRGIGSVEGNIVTVDFGDSFPAIYEMQPDGSLSGTWADGRASERLTPIGAQRT